jgi:hypothetical protein
MKLQVPPGTPVVNALAKQRAMLENILRACVGLAPENNMMLEYKWYRPWQVLLSGGMMNSKWWRKVTVFFNKKKNKKREKMRNTWKK